MNDSGCESSGVSASPWSLPGSFVDVESEKKNCDSNYDAGSDSSIWLVCTCIWWRASFSCSCKPCEKNSNACGVPSKISGDLGCPVGGKKEVIPGTFAATNNNGVAVYRREKAVVECVQGRVSVVARFALVEGEELRGCGCLNVGCYDDVG